jgi:hypothetical protein
MAAFGLKAALGIGQPLGARASAHANPQPQQSSGDGLILVNDSFSRNGRNGQQLVRTGTPMPLRQRVVGKAAAEPSRARQADRVLGRFF